MASELSWALGFLMDTLSPVSPREGGSSPPCCRAQGQRESFGVIMKKRKTGRGEVRRLHGMWVLLMEGVLGYPGEAQSSKMPVWPYRFCCGPTHLPLVGGSSPGGPKGFL